MSKHFAGLTPAFLDKLEPMLDRLFEHGCEMRPYYGIRTPLQQAALWRQSRTTLQIQHAMDQLRQQGAPHLAACIGAVGPQNGPRVTGALPGFSWHQWGEAMDCFAVAANGTADWDSSSRSYAMYAQYAGEFGLKAGRDFGDSPHVQLRSHEVPHHYTPAQVDREMVARFPEIAGLR